MLLLLAILAYLFAEIFAWWQSRHGRGPHE